MTISPRVPLTALGVAVLALLSSCRAISDGLRKTSAEAPPIIKNHVPLKYYYGDLQAQKGTLTTKGDLQTNDGQTRPYYLNAYDSAEADEVKRKGVRNEIIYELMTAIDQGYQDHERIFRAEFVTKGVVLDSTHMAVDLAATVMVPESTKTVLSAIAAGLGAVNTSIDKNFFDQKSIEIVVLEMRTLRKAKADEITKMLSTKSCVDYPLAAAIRDLVEYYFCGSATNALISLQAKASKPEQPENPPPLKNAADAPTTETAAKSPTKLKGNEGQVTVPGKLGPP